MTQKQVTFPFRSGIAYRTARIVALVALLLGAGSLAIISPLVHERTRSNASARLQSLVDTVANTTSAACFVEDAVLATDVAKGLLMNSVVSGVVIRSAEGELANSARDGKPWTQAELDRAHGIVRKIYSPFDSSAPVCEMVLIPDQEELTRLSRESMLFAVSMMSEELNYHLYASL